MEILSERTKKVVDMEVEFKHEEYGLLYHYAKDNIPQKVLSDLLVNWAVEDLLRKYIEKHIKLPVKKRKEKASEAAKGHHDPDHLAGTGDEKRPPRVPKKH